MKKWLIGAAAVLGLFLVWALWPRTPAIQIVSHDPAFVVYDVQYFASTNRIHYWRAAWRDTLNFFGFMQVRAQGKASECGPALVLYNSAPPTRGPWFPGRLIPDGETNGRPLNAVSSTEYFGNRLVTKFFCPLTNGQYHLVKFGTRKTGWTNVADITVER